ncbi:MAG: hypothetical protein AAF618_06460 [Pseudomonadota bacterium]
MAYLTKILGRTMEGAAWCGALLVASAAHAQDLRFSPELGLEVTGFAQAPQFPDQFEGLGSALIASGDVSWRSADRAVQVVLEPYLRFDSRDDARSYGDLRRGYLRYFGDRWDVTIGADRVFWGVVESVNVVDVINQRDRLENADLDEKLGAPILRVSAQTEIGDFDLYYLPFFRERAFPGLESRNRLPFEVDEGAATFERSDGEAADDFALRYSTRFGGFDLGLSTFYGTNRTPFLAFNGATGKLEPRYQRLRQTGLDVQYTSDAWLWKLEVAHKEIGDDAFVAAVGGFEYTFFDLAQSGRDLGVIVEYLHDGRDQAESPPTPFDDDLFLGARLTWNDVADTELLAGAIVDADTNATQLQVEFQRRIGTSNLLEIELRALDAQSDPLLTPAEDDGSLLVRWTRFF